MRPGNNMKHGNKAKEVRIALLGSGFVADFYMQGLANVNGHRVVVNYSRSPRRATAFARRSIR